METKVWRKLTTWLLTLLVAVFLMPTGLQYAFAADPQPQSDAPAFSKHLVDNGDGTYTLSLSVTGKSDTSTITNVNKANVILVLDTSSSMNNNAAAGTEADPHVYYTVYGTPGNPNTGGVAATYYRANPQAASGYSQVYYRNGNWYTAQNGGTQFTGPFYSRSRFWAEYHALTDDGGIIDSLLAQNTTLNPDIIEIAVADFGREGHTDLDFSSTSNTNAAAIKNVISGLSQSQGTNWEEGLIQAHNIYNTLTADEKANEQTYVVFLTDGQPTTHQNSYTVNTDDLSGEFNAAKDNANTLVETDGAEFYGVFTWGDQQYLTCVQSLVGYAYEGTGNYNTGSQGHADHVFNATSTQALIDALKQIADTITNNVGYTDTGVHDGVTSMTHSTVKATASGDVTGLKYYRGGGSYGTVDLDNGVYGTEWEDAPHATVGDDGTINWDLGENFDLEDGVTYTVTFVVWPDQDSLDLVADLNNGVRSYGSLTPDEQSQIVSSGGKYYLKTNTDFPSVSYKTYTQELDEDGNPIPGTRVESDKKVSEIANPDPVQLAEEKLNALKIWEDSLDPSQREEYGDSVTLFLKVDGKNYYVDEEGNPMGVTLLESKDWEETNYISIAPGLLVTENSPAYDASKPQYEWDDVTYAMIEPGHDYVFVEDEQNIHFELTAYHHHPMIMGENEDGTLHVVDVIFNEAQTEIIDIIELTDSLSATNALKGGINITKKVVKIEGETETELVDLNPFPITVTVTGPDGNALPTKETSDGTSYTIDYRIYYGPNNPKYDNPDPGTSDDDIAKHRSGHIYVSGTSFTETIYVGDTIRVVNVEDDSLYTVTETAPTGYEYVRTDYWYTYGDDSTVKEFEGAPSVQSNSASYGEVVNKLTYGSLEVSKTVKVGEDSGLTIDEDKEFTFTFKLYADATKQKELTGYKFNYTYTPASGTAETSTITEGDTFTLKHGEKFLIDKLPEETYYEVTETAESGYTTDPANLIAQGEVVKDTKREAKFTNTYTVNPVSVDPPVKKEITGTEELYNKGDFTFVIANTAAPEGITVPMPAKTSITNIEANELTDKPGYYEFGEITFKAPGTYTYTVTESGSVLGVTNDSEATKTLTFTVTDDGKGHLSVSPTTDEAVFEFTNVYKTGELDITKTVINGENADLKEFKFTVTLRDAEENEIEGEFPYTIYDENGEATEDTGTISSGDTLTLTDKQTAKITEIPDGALYEVVENEANTAGFTTTPADGFVAGTIVADETQTAAFTNEYEASPTTVSFPVKKVVVVPEGLTGPTDWSYTIDVTAEDGAPEADTMSGTVTKASPTITFGEFEYDAPGEYVYTVTETGTIAGVTNDPEDKTVTVTVVDKGDGTLEATADSTDASPVTFNNAYNVEPANVSFPVTKVVSVPEGLTGPADWSFDITVAAEDGAPEAETMTGTVTKAAPTITFGEFEFTAPGEYTYTVTETGTVAGVTNDPEDKTVTVTVVDNGDGTLTATADATEDAPVKFVNNYDIPNPVNVSIPVEKVMEVPEGMIGLETWSYDISVAADDTASPVAETMTGVVTKAEPTTTFGPFTFTKADIGTHTYTVSESGELPGVENDEESEKTVTITVADKGDGTLAVTTSFGEDSVVFTNAYCPGPVKTKIGVKKVIDSDYSHEDAINKEFTFTLTPVDGAPMPEGQEESASVTIKTTEGVGEDFFNEIEYTEMGTYKYTLVEEGITNPGPGWTYDTGSETKEHEVTVVVADGGNGKLVATVSGGGSAVIIDGEDTGDTEVDITNEYVITGIDSELTLEKKVVDLSNSKPDGQFTFTLHERNGDEIGDQIGEAQTITVTDGEPQNTVTFGPFHYDAPGEYEYAVLEDIQETQDGWTYDTVDTATHFYTVVVDPNFEEAVLVVNDDDSTLDASITNEYKAEATNADIVVKKIIDDNSDDSGSRKYNRTFTFTLTAGDNDVPGDYATPMPPAGNQITITGEGEAAFEDIPFEKCGVYNYTIKEVVRDGDGYICSTSTYEVAVTVVDESAKLVASVDYSKAGGTSEEESVHITNYYDPEDAVVALIATKVVIDNTGSAPDETFEFELVAEDGTVIETVSRENSGIVRFGKITYSKIGTYSYQIREVAGDTPGFTYDSSVYNVTVNVTDPGKSGVLQAEVIGNNPTFNNPYDVPPGESSVTDQIKITKYLKGRDLKDGEFTFILKDANGDVVGVATNDASGNVVFPKLKFSKIGSYTYTIYENPGDDADITYDKSIFTTTAVVTDPHDGKSLKVKWTCDQKTINFVNTYEPPEEPEKPKKPDTGDHNNLAGWLALMGLAGAGCGTMVYRRRRYNK